MAVGSKLGKILTGIGSGLMFVPGPWSAVGAALTVGGQVAGQVGAAKERKEEESMAQEQANQPQQMQTEPADQSRPQQAQLETNPQQPQQMQAPTSNVFQPNQTGLGGYQSQLDAAISNLILGNGPGEV